MKQKNNQRNREKETMPWDMRASIMSEYLEVSLGRYLANTTELNKGSLRMNIQRYDEFLSTVPEGMMPVIFGIGLVYPYLDKFKKSMEGEYRWD